jgi:hypothetical protein
MEVQVVQVPVLVVVQVDQVPTMRAVTMAVQVQVAVIHPEEPVQKGQY